ncbi:hypothetical protein P7C71_g2958, partial [Lecanoromycetidae sp. Uapishka_2]
MSDSRLYEEAFAQRPDLQKRVTDAISRAPDLNGLFGDIAHYINNLQASTQSSAGKNGEQPSKKRKLEHRPLESGWDKETYTTVKDVSLSIPQRKKLTLELGQSQKTGIRVVNPTGEIEIAVLWSSIHDVVCLPVPEKAQAQYNFCVFSAAADGTAPEQMLWTVPDSAPKDGTMVGGPSFEASDTYKMRMIAVINKGLQPYKKRVLEPDRKEFASQIVQAHRKSEVAFHVKAFRGSKDGYLFLLSTGILWGFKKPLEFFAFDSIDSVSYTSVLQRTFNLNIAVRTSQDATVQEYEFSMIDQADFGGIDNYIKRHELQDASMAEQRRAKKLNVNGVKGEKADDGDGEQEGELEKAQREAEDLEDEEEEEDENFDPGSEGESEGSGSSSEEEDDGGGGGEANLVDEELGSEAESVDE